MEFADKLTPCTPQEMMDAMYRAWCIYMGGPPDNNDALRILLAQWAEETGWGHACHNWNIGNVKASAGGAQGWQYFKCEEDLEASYAKKLVAADPRHVCITGNFMRKGVLYATTYFLPKHSGCCFRAFDTCDQGVLDHIVLLVNNPRFSQAWPAVVHGDPAAYAHLLKVAGYYTADESIYAQTVSSLFRQFKKIEPTAVPAAAQDDETSNWVALSLQSAQDDIVRLENVRWTNDDTNV